MQDPQNRSTHGINTSNRKMKPNFFAGALVGAGLALLFAPAKGKETRRRIGHTAKKVGGSARNVFGRTRESIRGIQEDAKTAMERGREEYRRSRAKQGQAGAWSPTS